MSYSIIIPILNEETSLRKFLPELEELSIKNEILFIDDGSTDKSNLILNNYSYCKTIRLDKNTGKGAAIIKGLINAQYNKIVIFDGDLELQTNDINKLMILNKKDGINFALGSRIYISKLFDFSWNFGNYIFTYIFNLIHQSEIEDSLCCAKSFFKNDIDPHKLKSRGFDIDIELTSLLIKKFKKGINIHLKYKRRKNSNGKKLKYKDSLIIMKRLILQFYSVK